MSSFGHHGASSSWTALMLHRSVLPLLVVTALLVCSLIYVELSRAGQSVAAVTAGTQAPTVARVASLTKEVADLRQQLRQARNETRSLQLKWITERDEVLREAELLHLQRTSDQRGGWARDRELAYRLTRLEQKLGMSDILPELEALFNTNNQASDGNGSGAYVKGFEYGTPQSRPALEQRLAEYTKWHHDAIHGDLTSYKYFIFKPESSGLGNRVTSMASAFLVALLTNRVFLVHWQSPSPMSTQLVSNVLQLDPRPLMPALSRMKSDRINWQLDQNTPLCGDLDALADVVYMSGTGQHFACFVANNPRYRTEVNRLFSQPSAPILSVAGFEGPSHGQIFAPLERYLVRPISELQQRIVTLTKSFEGHYVIGMQVRVGIARLAMNTELPEPQLLQIWSQSRDVATKHTGGDVKAMANVRYFLGADEQRIYTSAKQFFGDQLLFNPDDVSDEWRAKSDDAEKTARLIKAEQDGVVVNWALSRCNALVYTLVSSFGQIAGARMSWLDPSAPVYEFRLQGQEIVLKLRTTREPICNHWDKASCSGRGDAVWTWRTGWHAA